MTNRRVPGLATRLFLAQTLIVLVAALTLWLVASAVGPALFHNHLHRAGVHVTAETNQHVEDAFRSASAISIGVALLASLVAAIAVSGFVTRRIADPVTHLASAARNITAGRHPAPVPATTASSEFADLTTAFNAMTERLDAVETTRRRQLADLAHEMRTPISTLDGYLQGVEDGVVDLDTATPPDSPASPKTSPPCPKPRNTNSTCTCSRSLPPTSSPPPQMPRTTVTKRRTSA